MMIYNVTVNDLVNPFLDSCPRFSWKIKSEQINTLQLAYRITVTAPDKPDITVWDTGWRQSEDHLYIPCTTELQPMQQYAFQIAVQTNHGSCQSENHYFHTAKCNSPWIGRWIGAHFSKQKEEIARAVYLRQDFDALPNIQNAVLYIAGLGHFEATINGQKCGDDFLSTPYTPYHIQVQYRAFTVTDLCRNGKNTLGIVLGNGFYNSTTRDPWQSATAIWRDAPKALAELHIQYEDGSEAILATDGQWHCAKGPIAFNGMRHGEHYDATMEEPGWDTPGFIAGENWQPVRMARAPGGLLKVMEMEPIRILHTHSPKKSWMINGAQIFDIGQCQSGIANICFKGKHGDRITIRYSDLVYEDGSLNQESFSGFSQDQPFHTDVFVKGSDEPEQWHPRFAYHGFRYIEITGNTVPFGDEDVQAWTLGNDLPIQGDFACHDETLNQIHKLAAWSTKSMLFSLMASDTIREQTSWTGDTGLSAEQLMMNLGAETFMKNWQQVLRDTQLPSGTLPCIVPSAGWGYNALNGPDWCNPIYEVPNQLYLQCRDIQVLRDNYDALKRYCGYLAIMANDHIISYGLGDWCSPFDGPALYVNMSACKCPVAVTDTAYYYSAVRALADHAKILGYEADAQQYSAQAYAVKDAFRRHFYDPQTATVQGNCQTSTAIMIWHGLADAQEIPALINTLLSQIQATDGLLDFGILGMKAVLNALGEYGHTHLAVQMLTDSRYPSIKWWIDQGATTLWECWNGGGSHNHHMFSDVSAFLYKYVLGIRLPGLNDSSKRITFAPPLSRRNEWAKGHLYKTFGDIAFAWKTKDRASDFSLDIPVGYNGQLILPLSYQEDAQAFCASPSGNMSSMEITDHFVILCFVSGKYRLSLSESA